MTYCLFFYLSTKGYIPYKLRRHKLYHSIEENKKKKIKKPINKKNLAFWACFWILGPLLLGLFSRNIFVFIYILNYPLIIFLFISISTIKVIRAYIGERSLLFQKILMGLNFLFLFLVFKSPLVLYQFFNEGVVNLLITIFIISISNKVFTYFQFKDKSDLYLKQLSLYKRNLKKESYVSISKTNENRKSLDDPHQSSILKKKNGEYRVIFEEKINQFNKELRKQIPFWFSKLEKKEIIYEIEGEIREITAENEKENNLYTETFQKITDNIISEYKHRGTPKIFISKELWTRYILTLKSSLFFFLIIGLLQIVLNLSFNYQFNLLGIFLNLSMYWFLSILIIHLLSKIFIFLSVSDYIPGFKYKSKPKKQFFFILEFLLIALYFLSGTIILIFTFTSGDFNNNPESQAILTLFSSLLFFLGVVKSSKILFYKKKLKISRILISIGLVVCFILNVLLFHNRNGDFSILQYYDMYLDIIIINLNVYIWFNLVAVPINIEILYDIISIVFYKNSK